LQQALTLRSRKAPKLTALQQASSGAGQASKQAASKQASSEAEKLRKSSGAWSLLASSNKTNKNKIKNKHFT
jgi:hypothetical protein